MGLRELDFLSPKITLYFSNSQSHRSKISAVLTIIHFLIVGTCMVYYSCIIFLRKKQTTSFFKTFVDDPGISYINSTRFFHYLKFKDNFQYDPKVLSVVGAEIGPIEGLSITNETFLDHWRYGVCNLSQIVGKEEQSQLKDSTGLCVKEFYNSTTNKLYAVGEEGYVSPSIKHGISNINSVPYAILLRHCQNSSYSECYDQDIINEKIATLKGVSMNVLNLYVDIKDYKKPFYHYFNSHEIGIIQNSVRVSYSYFNPVTIKTWTGLVFDSASYLHGYSFNQEVRGSYEPHKNGMVAMLFFLMYNHIDFYERKYAQFVDIVAIISGIFRLSSTLFLALNFIIHKATTLNDFWFFLERKYEKVMDKTLTTGTNAGAKSMPMHSGLYTLKNNYLKTSMIKHKVPKNVKIGFVKLLRLYLKIGKNSAISEIIKLRKRIVSEETIIKNFFNFQKLKLNTLKENESSKKPKALTMIGTIYDYKFENLITKSIEESRNASLTELVNKNFGK